MDVTQSDSKRLHPVLWVAAVAVTIFSAVGIAAITGVIPVAGSTPKPLEPVLASTNAAAGAPASTATAAGNSAPLSAATPSAADVAPATVRASTAPAPAPHAVQHPASKKHSNHSKQVVARNETAVLAAAPPPASASASAPALCQECGVIESVREVKKPGEGSGLGAVAGGVLGGVVGHQMGAGRGRDVATVLGAVGGAFGGHQVEKAVRTASKFEIVVRYDDGTSQAFSQDAAPAWRSGDRVKVINGVIMAN